MARVPRSGPSLTSELFPQPTNRLRLACADCRDFDCGGGNCLAVGGRDPALPVQPVRGEGVDVGCRAGRHSILLDQP